MFALVDCNNFYASCERMFRPALNNKPICVLSNNDGCVIARSNEAKSLGVPMGALAFEWEKFFIQNKVHVFSANFALYGDMSNRVMAILSDFSPDIEIYSIDEMFLGLEGMDHLDLLKYGEKMRKKVLQWTGIPISIGFGPTKALSKLSNRIAKKFPQLNSVYSIDTDEKRIKALKWLPIEDVWGIGRQHSRRLRMLGVKTAFDFINLHDSLVRKQMGVVGLRLKHDLEGKPTLQLDDVKSKKAIAVTRSFDRNYTNIEDLKERIASFSVSCAEKLRKQFSECNSILVFIHTNGFRPEQPQYRKSIVVKLPFPTNSSMEMAGFALKALEMIYKDGYKYKKAGVIVQDFTPASEKQLTFFGQSDLRHKPLMECVDRINKAFGQQKIRLAAQDLKKVWKMRQVKLSPRYTTNLNEIITIEV